MERAKFSKRQERGRGKEADERREGTEQDRTSDGTLPCTTAGLCKASECPLFVSSAAPAALLGICVWGGGHFKCLSLFPAWKMTSLWKFKIGPLKNFASFFPNHPLSHPYPPETPLYLDLSCQWAKDGVIYVFGK